MKVKGMTLGWIVVKDLNQAIDFYVNTVGLTLRERTDEYGWAELSGPEGCILGIAQEDGEMQAGSNTVLTVAVEDIDEAIAHYQAKGAHLIGDLVEIPGHVKMQTFKDPDGNMFQIAQQLEALV